MKFQIVDAYVCVCVCGRATYVLVPLHSAGSESVITSAELQNISDKIADIWTEVGLELGLKLYKLNVINVENPANAPYIMLNKWKETNRKASISVLNKAIEKCRAKKGTGL